MVVEITCDCIFDALDFRNEQLIGIRNNTIIRSGIKSILNFRHNIEKYGFKCLEFGNPLVVPILGSTAILAWTR